MHDNASRTKRLVVLSLFLACSMALGIVEQRLFFLDFAIPGVKLGLSNVVILTMLYIFKPSEVLAAVLLKCVIIASFVSGFSSFLYSLGGSLCSLGVMLLLIKTLDERISPIGVSVAGAVFHNLGQLLVASFIISSPMIFSYLPILMISGVITGILVGIAVKFTYIRIKKIINL